MNGRATVWAWVSFLTGTAILTSGVLINTLAFGAVPFAFVGLSLIGLAVSGNYREPVEELYQWATESARGLPNEEILALNLMTYVNKSDIPTPWDPSTVEDVERLIDEARTIQHGCRGVRPFSIEIRYDER